MATFSEYAGAVLLSSNTRVESGSLRIGSHACTIAHLEGPLLKGISVVEMRRRQVPPFHFPAQIHPAGPGILPSTILLTSQLLHPVVPIVNRPHEH